MRYAPDPPSANERVEATRALRRSSAKARRGLNPLLAHLVCALLSLHELPLPLPLPPSPCLSSYLSWTILSILRRTSMHIFLYPWLLSLPLYLLHRTLHLPSLWLGYPQQSLKHKYPQFPNQR